MGNSYILQSNTFGMKAGTELIWLNKNSAGKADFYVSKLHIYKDIFIPASIVENNPEWFLEKKEEKPKECNEDKVLFSLSDFAKIIRTINDGTYGKHNRSYLNGEIHSLFQRKLSQPPVDTDAPFQWTDELVKEMLYSKLPLPAHYAGKVQKCLDEFKQSKYTPKQEDNEELIGLLRDCVSSTWGNPSLDKTQVLFDKFLHDRKLAKPSQSLINAFITDSVNRNMYDKKYSEKELLEAEEKAFNAARKTWKGQIPYTVYGEKPEYITYKTFSDYKKTIENELNNPTQGQSYGGENVSIKQTCPSGSIEVCKILFNRTHSKCNHIFITNKTLSEEDCNWITLILKLYFSNKK